MIKPKVWTHEWAWFTRTKQLVRSTQIHRQLLVMGHMSGRSQKRQWNCFWPKVWVVDPHPPPPVIDRVMARRENLYSAQVACLLEVRLSLTAYNCQCSTPMRPKFVLIFEDNRLEIIISNADNSEVWIITNELAWRTSYTSKRSSSIVGNFWVKWRSMNIFWKTCQ